MADTSPYTERVAAAVAQAIESAGSSLSAVAKSGAIPYVTLHRKINGGKPFNVTELDRIAGFLGIDVEQLTAPQEYAA